MVPPNASCKPLGGRVVGVALPLKSTDWSRVPANMDGHGTGGMRDIARSQALEFWWADAELRHHGFIVTNDQHIRSRARLPFALCRRGIHRQDSLA